MPFLGVDAADLLGTFLLLFLLAGGKLPIFALWKTENCIFAEFQERCMLSIDFLRGEALQAL